MWKELYPDEGGGMGIIVIITFGIPTILLIYGIFMQLVSHLWLH